MFFLKPHWKHEEERNGKISIRHSIISEYVPVVDSSMSYDPWVIESLPKKRFFPRRIAAIVFLILITATTFVLTDALIKRNTEIRSQASIPKEPSPPKLVTKIESKKLGDEKRPTADTPPAKPPQQPAAGVPSGAVARDYKPNATAKTQTGYASWGDYLDAMNMQATLNIRAGKGNTRSLVKGSEQIPGTNKTVAQFVTENRGALTVAQFDAVSAKINNTTAMTKEGQALQGSGTQVGTTQIAPSLTVLQDPNVQYAVQVYADVVNDPTASFSDRPLVLADIQRTTGYTPDEVVKLNELNNRYNKAVNDYVTRLGSLTGRSGVGTVDSVIKDIAKTYTLDWTQLKGALTSNTNVSEAVKKQQYYTQKVVPASNSYFDAQKALDEATPGKISYSVYKNAADKAKQAYIAVAKNYNPSLSEAQIVNEFTENYSKAIAEIRAQEKRNPVLQNAANELADSNFKAQMVGETNKGVTADIQKKYNLTADELSTVVAAANQMVQKAVALASVPKDKNFQLLLAKDIREAQQNYNEQAGSLVNATLKSADTTKPKGMVENAATDLASLYKTAGLVGSDGKPITKDILLTQAMDQVHKEKWFQLKAVVDSCTNFYCDKAATNRLKNYESLNKDSKGIVDAKNTYDANKAKIAAFEDALSKIFVFNQNPNVYDEAMKTIDTVTSSDPRIKQMYETALLEKYKENFPAQQQIIVNAATSRIDPSKTPTYQALIAEEKMIQNQLSSLDPTGQTLKDVETLVKNPLTEDQLKEGYFWYKAIADGKKPFTGNFLKDSIGDIACDQACAKTNLKTYETYPTFRLTDAGRQIQIDYLNKKSTVEQFESVVSGMSMNVRIPYELNKLVTSVGLNKGTTTRTYSYNGQTLTLENKDLVSQYDYILGGKYGQIDPRAIQELSAESARVTTSTGKTFDLMMTKQSIESFLSFNEGKLHPYKTGASGGLGTTTKYVDNRLTLNDMLTLSSIPMDLDLTKLSEHPLSQQAAIVRLWDNQLRAMVKAEQLDPNNSSYKLIVDKHGNVIDPQYSGGPATQLMEDLYEGKVNAINQENALKALRIADPVKNLYIGYNNITQGFTKDGWNRYQNTNLSFGQRALGLMQAGAAPAATAVLIAVPFSAPFIAGGALLASPVIIASTMVGAGTTMYSLQNTGYACSSRGSGTDCAFAIGNTGFMALSTGLGMYSGIVSAPVARANLAVANAVRTGEMSAANVATELAAISQQYAPQLASIGLARKVVDVTGLGLFGIQGVKACAAGDGQNCVMNLAMAASSFLRLTSPVPQAGEFFTSQMKAASSLDKVVNFAQIGAGCAMSGADCAQAIGGAAVDFTEIPALVGKGETTSGFGKIMAGQEAGVETGNRSSMIDAVHALNDARYLASDQPVDPAVQSNIRQLEQTVGERVFIVGQEQMGLSAQLPKGLDISGKANDQLQLQQKTYTDLQQNFQRSLETYDAALKSAVRDTTNSQVQDALTRAKEIAVKVDQAAADLITTKEAIGLLRDPSVGLLERLSSKKVTAANDVKKIQDASNFRTLLEDQGINPQDPQFLAQRIALEAAWRNLGSRDPLPIETVLSYGFTDRTRAIKEELAQLTIQKDPSYLEKLQKDFTDAQKEATLKGEEAAKVADQARDSLIEQGRLASQQADAIQKEIERINELSKDNGFVTQEKSLTDQLDVAQKLAAEWQTKNQDRIITSGTREELQDLAVVMLDEAKASLPDTIEANTLKKTIDLLDQDLQSKRTEITEIQKQIADLKDQGVMLNEEQQQILAESQKQKGIITRALDRLLGRTIDQAELTNIQNIQKRAADLEGIQKNEQTVSDEMNAISKKLVDAYAKRNELLSRYDYQSASQVKDKLVQQRVQLEQDQKVLDQQIQEKTSQLQIQGENTALRGEINELQAQKSIKQMQIDELGKAESRIAKAVDVENQAKLKQQAYDQSIPGRLTQFRELATNARVNLVDAMTTRLFGPPTAPNRLSRALTSLREFITGVPVDTTAEPVVRFTELSKQMRAGIVFYGDSNVQIDATAKARVQQEVDAYNKTLEEQVKNKAMTQEEADSKKRIVPSAQTEPYRLKEVPSGSKALNQDIKDFNALLDRFESSVGYHLYKDQVKTLLRPEAILQLKAGGGKTTVIGPLLAVTERTTVFALPTFSDAVSFVNDTVKNRAFFEGEGLTIYYYDSTKGFLKIDPQPGQDGFNPFRAEKVNITEVQEAADRAALDPKKYGLMIITEASKNAWGQIQGRNGSDPASILDFEFVMGKRDFTVVFDEIGAVVNSRYSVSGKGLTKIQDITDGKNLHGLPSAAYMLEASNAVRDAKATQEIRKTVLERLQSKQSTSDLFFSYTDSKGTRTMRPYPKDMGLVGRSYKELLDQTLSKTPQDAPIRETLENLRKIFEADPSNASIRGEFEQLLQDVTTYTDEGSRAALNDLSYRVSDLQSRWFTMSQTPDVHFGFERIKTPEQIQYEASLEELQQQESLDKSQYDKANAINEADRTDQQQKVVTDYQDIQRRITELETQIRGLKDKASGEVVIRKSGGTTGETYSTVTQRIALQQEGLDMLRASGVNIDRTVVSVGELTITPDSDQITNVEIMRYKASRGKLKGYDATPDTAANALGVAATDVSETPPRPSWFVRNESIQGLIHDGITNKTFLQKAQGKTLAFVIADDGTRYDITTDTLANELKGVEIVSRTRYFTDPNGGEHTEYYIEQIVRNADGTIQERVEMSRPATQAEWSKVTQDLLTKANEAKNPGSVMIVYEGRTRAVDFEVTENNKNIRWTTIANDTTGMEDLTQSWKRNRVAAFTENDLVQHGWSADTVKNDQTLASEMGLWIRSNDTSITQDTAVKRSIDVHIEHLAQQRFEGAMQDLASSPKTSLQSVRELLLSRKPESQRTAIEASMETMIADTERAERALLLEIQEKPLSGDDIPLEVFNRGQKMQYQMEIMAARLQKEFSLTNRDMTLVRQAMGIDTPYPTQEAFLAKYNEKAVSAPLQLPKGPAQIAMYWAETNDPTVLPLSVWHNKTPDTTQLAGQATAAKTPQGAQPPPAAGQAQQKAPAQGVVAKTPEQQITDALTVVDKINTKQSITASDHINLIFGLNAALQQIQNFKEESVTTGLIFTSPQKTNSVIPQTQPVNISYRAFDTKGNQLFAGASSGEVFTTPGALEGKIQSYMANVKQWVTDSRSNGEGVVTVTFVDEEGRNQVIPIAVHKQSSDAYSIKERKETKKIAVTDEEKKLTENLTLLQTMAEADVTNRIQQTANNNPSQYGSLVQGGKVSENIVNAVLAYETAVITNIIDRGSVREAEKQTGVERKALATALVLTDDSQVNAFIAALSGELFAQVEKDVASAKAGTGQVSPVVPAQPIIVPTNPVADALGGIADQVQNVLRGPAAAIPQGIRKAAQGAVDNLGGAVENLTNVRDDLLQQIADKGDQIQTLLSQPPPPAQPQPVQPAATTLPPSAAAPTTTVVPITPAVSIIESGADKTGRFVKVLVDGNEKRIAVDEEVDIGNGYKLKLIQDTTTTYAKIDLIPTNPSGIDDTKKLSPSPILLTRNEVKDFLQFVLTQKKTIDEAVIVLFPPIQQSRMLLTDVESILGNNFVFTQLKNPNKLDKQMLITALNEKWSDDTTNPARDLTDTEKQDVKQILLRDIKNNRTIINKYKQLQKEKEKPDAKKSFALINTLSRELESDIEQRLNQLFSERGWKIDTSSSAFTQHINSMLDSFLPILQAQPNFWERGLARLGTFFGKAGTFFSSRFTNAWSSVKAAFNRWAQTLPSWLSWMPVVIVAGVGVVTLLTGGAQIIGGLLVQIGIILTYGIKAIGSFFTSLITTIGNILSWFGVYVIGPIGGVLTFVRDYLATLPAGQILTVVGIGIGAVAAIGILYVIVWKIIPWVFRILTKLWGGVTRLYNLLWTGDTGFPATINATPFHNTLRWSLSRLFPLFWFYDLFRFIIWLPVSILKIPFTIVNWFRKPPATGTQTKKKLKPGWQKRLLGIILVGGLIYGLVVGFKTIAPHIPSIGIPFFGNQQQTSEVVETGQAEVAQISENIASTEFMNKQGFEKVEGGRYGHTVPIWKEQFSRPLNMGDVFFFFDTSNDGTTTLRYGLVALDENGQPLINVYDVDVNFQPVSFLGTFPIDSNFPYGTTGTQVSVSKTVSETVYFSMYRALEGGAQPSSQLSESPEQQALSPRETIITSTYNGNQKSARLDQIALTVFAETANGVDPDEMQRLLAWSVINRAYSPRVAAYYTQVFGGRNGLIWGVLGEDANGDTIDEQTIRIADMWLPADENACNSQCQRFKNTLRIVQETYQAYLNREEDPTKGSIFFSKQNELSRGEIKLQSAEDLKTWLEENSIGLGASYVSKPFEQMWWNKEKDVVEGTGVYEILYFGNDNCVSFGFCSGVVTSEETGVQSQSQSTIPEQLVITDINAIADRMVEELKPTINPENGILYIPASKPLWNIEKASGDNICGPLSAEILKRAGYIPQTANPRDFWYMDTSDPGKRNVLKQNLEDTGRYSYESHSDQIGSYDFSQNRLQPGDFLYLKGGDFIHMVAVSEIDQEGRAWSVTNVKQPDGTFLVQKVVLYDPINPNTSMFTRWNTPGDSVGSTGQSFEWFRVTGQQSSLQKTPVMGGILGGINQLGFAFQNILNSIRSRLTGQQPAPIQQQPATTTTLPPQLKNIVTPSLTDAERIRSERFSRDQILAKERTAKNPEPIIYTVSIWKNGSKVDTATMTFVKEKGSVWKQVSKTAVVSTENLMKETEFNEKVALWGQTASNQVFDIQLIAGTTTVEEKKSPIEQTIITKPIEPEQTTTEPSIPVPPEMISAEPVVVSLRDEQIQEANLLYGQLFNAMYRDDLNAVFNRIITILVNYGDVVTPEELQNTEDAVAAYIEGRIEQARTDVVIHKNLTTMVGYGIARFQSLEVNRGASMVEKLTAFQTTLASITPLEEPQAPVFEERRQPQTPSQGIGQLSPNDLPELVKLGIQNTHPTLLLSQIKVVDVTKTPSGVTVYRLRADTGEEWSLDDSGGAVGGSTGAPQPAGNPALIALQNQLQALQDQLASVEINLKTVTDLYYASWARKQAVDAWASVWEELIKRYPKRQPNQTVLDTLRTLLLTDTAEGITNAINALNQITQRIQEGLQQPLKPVLPQPLPPPETKKAEPKAPAEPAKPVEEAVPATLPPEAQPAAASVEPPVAVKPAPEIPVSQAEKTPEPAAEQEKKAAEELAGLKSQLAEANTALSDSQRVLNEANAEKKQGDEQRAKLESDLVVLTQQNESLQTQITALTGESTAQTDAVKNLRNQLTKSQTTQTNLKKKIAQLNTDNTKLTNDLTEKQEELITLKSQFEGEQKKVRDLETQAVVDEQTLGEQQQALSAAQTEVTRLTEVLASATQTQETVTNQLNEQTKALKSALSETQTAKDAQTVLASQLAETQKQLDALKTSTLDVEAEERRQALINEVLASDEGPTLVAESLRVLTPSEVDSILQGIAGTELQSRTSALAALRNTIERRAQELSNEASTLGEADKWALIVDVLQNDTGATIIERTFTPTFAAETINALSQTVSEARRQELDQLKNDIVNRLSDPLDQIMTDLSQKMTDIDQKDARKVLSNAIKQVRGNARVQKNLKSYVNSGNTPDAVYVLTVRLRAILPEQYMWVFDEPALLEYVLGQVIAEKVTVPRTQAQRRQPTQPSAPKTTKPVVEVIPLSDEEIPEAIVVQTGFIKLSEPLQTQVAQAISDTRSVVQNVEQFARLPAQTQVTIIQTGIRSRFPFETSGMTQTAYDKAITEASIMLYAAMTTQNDYRATLPKELKTLLHGKTQFINSLFRPECGAFLIQKIFAADGGAVCGQAPAWISTLDELTNPPFWTALKFVSGEMSSYFARVRGLTELSLVKRDAIGVRTEQEAFVPELLVPATISYTLNKFLVDSIDAFMESDPTTHGDLITSLNSESFRQFMDLMVGVLTPEDRKEAEKLVSALIQIIVNIPRSDWSFDMTTDVVAMMNDLEKGISNEGPFSTILENFGTTSQEERQAQMQTLLATLSDATSGRLDVEKVADILLGTTVSQQSLISSVFDTAVTNGIISLQQIEDNQSLIHEIKNSLMQIPDFIEAIQSTPYTGSPTDIGAMLSWMKSVVDKARIESEMQKFDDFQNALIRKQKELEATSVQTQEVIQQLELNKAILESVRERMVEAENAAREGKPLQLSAGEIPPAQPEQIVTEGEKPIDTIVGNLVIQHLLRLHYHVFQSSDIRGSRNSVDQQFETVQKSGYFERDLFGRPPYGVFVEKVFGGRDKDYSIYEDLVNHTAKRTKFTTSDGKTVQLGHAFLLQTNTKFGSVVLLQGSFSTEGDSTRKSGRMNDDNQILFLFDTEEAATEFMNLFDDSPYTNDPKPVERNTRIIEQALKNLWSDSKITTQIISHLLYGIEIRKYKKIGIPPPQPQAGQTPPGGEETSWRKEQEEAQRQEVTFLHQELSDATLVVSFDGSLAFHYRQGMNDDALVEEIHRLIQETNTDTIEKLSLLIGQTEVDTVIDSLVNQTFEDLSWSTTVAPLLTDIPADERSAFILSYSRDSWRSIGNQLNEIIDSTLSDRGDARLQILSTSSSRSDVENYFRPRIENVFMKLRNIVQNSAITDILTTTTIEDFSREFIEKEVVRMTQRLERTINRISTVESDGNRYPNGGREKQFQAVNDMLSTLNKNKDYKTLIAVAQEFKSLLQLRESTAEILTSNLPIVGEQPIWKRILKPKNIILGLLAIPGVSVLSAISLFGWFYAVNFMPIPTLPLRTVTPITYTYQGAQQQESIESIRETQVFEPTSTLSQQKLETIQIQKEFNEAPSYISYILKGFFDNFIKPMRREHLSDPVAQARLFGRHLDANEIEVLVNSPILHVVNLGGDLDQEGDFNQTRTDIILDTYINLETGRITTVSLPRDLLGARGYDSVNPLGDLINTWAGTYFQGVGLTSDQFSKKNAPLENVQARYEAATGVPVDVVNIINFDGFKKLVDTLYPDGMKIKVPFEFYISDGNAPIGKGKHDPGTYTMTGTDVLAFIRTRQIEQQEGAQKVPVGGPMGRMQHVDLFLKILLKNQISQLPQKFMDNGLNIDGVVKEYVNVFENIGKDMLSNVPWVDKQTNSGVVYDILFREESVRRTVGLPAFIEKLLNTVNSIHLNSVIIAPNSPQSLQELKQQKNENIYRVLQPFGSSKYVTPSFDSQSCTNPKCKGSWFLSESDPDIGRNPSKMGSVIDYYQEIRNIIHENLPVGGESALRDIFTGGGVNMLRVVTQSKLWNNIVGGIVSQVQTLRERSTTPQELTQSEVALEEALTLSRIIHSQTIKQIDIAEYTRLYNIALAEVQKVNVSNQTNHVVQTVYIRRAIGSSQWVQFTFIHPKGTSRKTNKYASWIYVAENQKEETIQSVKMEYIDASNNPYSVTELPAFAIEENKGSFIRTTLPEIVQPAQPSQYQTTQKANEEIQTKSNSLFDRVKGWVIPVWTNINTYFLQLQYQWIAVPALPTFINTLFTPVQQGLGWAMGVVGISQQVQKTESNTGSYTKTIVVNGEQVEALVLGTADPLTVDPEHPKAGEIVLYHGSNQPLSVAIQYNPQENTGDNTQTLGIGMYTTDNRDQAVLYANQRGGEKVVSLVIPHNAAMLDLRGAKKFPKSMFREWVKKIQTIYPDDWIQAQQYYGIRNDLTFYKAYLKYLDYSYEKESYSLRDILGTSFRFPEFYGGVMYSGTPIWKEEFTQIMRAFGFDGVIAVERGDWAGSSAADSFVFYNYGVVGTKEDWIERRQKQNGEKPLNLLTPIL